MSLSGGSVYDDFAKAMVIFKKYIHERGVAVGHDVVYAGPDPEVVTPEDLQKLASFGWQADPEGCFRKFV